MLLGSVGAVGGTALRGTASATEVFALDEHELAASSSDPIAELFSADELNAMLLTPEEVDGHHANPDIVAEGGWATQLPARLVCAEAGSALLFEAEAQAYTVLDDDAITVVEQFASAGVELDQQRRCAEAAAALDACDGASIDADDGTVAITRLDDASLPTDARLFRHLFTHESGWEKPYHVGYARIGPVLTVLLFDGIETPEVLTIVHRGLSRIAEATGSPGPSDTVGPPAPPEAAAIPDGFVEQPMPEFVEGPATACIPATPPGERPQPPTEPEPPALRHSTPQWVAEAELGFYEPFAASDGLVFLMDGTSLVALRATDGTTAWRRTTGSDPSYLAIGSSLVVANQDEGLVTVAALDPSSGEQRWATAVRFEATYWGLSATDDTVYLHLMPDDPDADPNAGETRAVDSDTGVVRWRVDGPPVGATTGIVLVGVADGCGLTALDAVTGAARWTFGLDTFGTSIEVVGGQLLALRDQQLMALDLDSGETLWTSQLPAVEGRTGWADDGRRLYVVHVEDFGSHTVTALDSRDGSILWSVSAEPPPGATNLATAWGSTIDIDDGVVVTSNGETVVRFDAATGAVLSIDDMLEAVAQLEPDNSEAVHVVLHNGAARTIGSDHVVRIM